MISSRDELIRNINRLRSSEGKRPLTKAQVAMVDEQVTMRARLGRFTLFPEALEKALIVKEGGE